MLNMSTITGKIQCLSIILLCGVSSGISKDLGVHGPLFMIEEEDLLQVIQRKLEILKNSGKINRLSDRLNQALRARSYHPGSQFLPRRQEKISRVIDPSITVQIPIRDHHGKSVVKAGTKYNPLDHVSWGVPLLIFDGTDAEQIDWAIQHEGKWVLIRGNPFALSHQYKRWVYVDQGGGLVKRFRLTHVPIRIYQRKGRLVIEEGMK